MVLVWAQAEHVRPFFIFLGEKVRPLLPSSRGKLKLSETTRLRLAFGGVT